MGARPRMHELPLDERRAGFDEVERGLALHEVLAEASRCLFCHDAPCVSGCPAGVDVPGFIRRLKTKNFIGAARLIRETNVFAGVCARVCPAEELCEKRCSSTNLSEPIAIAALQRFAADEEAKRGIKLPHAAAPTGKRVAVVGSGPAGLACAHELVRLGHAVTLYEGEENLGGLLVHGIPRYRLPLAVAKTEVDAVLASPGLEVSKGVWVGRDVSMAAIRRSCDAVFLAPGLGEVSSLGIPGEGLHGVLKAGEFLRSVATGACARLEGRVVVIGGGNVAMDAACSALRCGASEVVVVYRRSREELPAWRREYEFALAEGVRFEFLTAPVRFVGDGGRLAAVECVRTRLGEPDAGGRKRPEMIPGTEHMIEVRTVIVAVGQAPRPELVELFGGGGLVASGAAAFVAGLIPVDQSTMMTPIEGVFAGGDAVDGGATVVKAVAEGRKAARAIHAYLQ
ncbi:MAG: NAD(P)-dependent oxidoreductase [Firmicutes bacterium]|jgi:glutamate synthase (NADPH/NADH) small chain|nr:NAD(P)-dependent oxidoreductase [Bacillota bacterium]MDH7496037.1 NAD(P)-dependent oxidoreductase [Bacillota bacterium]